jgi:hypothetical protein
MQASPATLQFPAYSNALLYENVNGPEEASEILRQQPLTHPMIRVLCWAHARQMAGDSVWAKAIAGPIIFGGTHGDSAVAGIGE